MARKLLRPEPSETDQHNNANNANEETRPLERVLQKLLIHVIHGFPSPLFPIYREKIINQLYPHT